VSEPETLCVSVPRTGSFSTMTSLLIGSPFL
jgi:hypothetical protein